MARTITKFTQARRDAVIAALQSGHTIKTAAGMAGVSRQTLYVWLARGEKEPAGQYGAFLQAVQEAESQAADVAITTWTKQMPDDWRASMEYLSRRHPDEWGKRERHEITGAEGEPIRVELIWPTNATEPSDA